MDYIELIYNHAYDDKHKLTYGVTYKCKFINSLVSDEIIITNDNNISIVFPRNRFVTIKEWRDKQIDKILK